MAIRKDSGLGKRTHLLALMVAAGLLMSGSCFATDDGTPVQGIEALLRKVEQRVDAKHMMSPEGDSAMDAWQQVLLVIPSTDPERARNALRNFAVHWRRRANEEQRDGNISVSAGLSVFASEAEAMISGKPDSAPAAEVTATDVAPASSLNLSTLAPSDAGRAVPQNMEVLTPASAEPPQPSPVVPPRVHHVSDIHPHTAGPPRRQVDVPETKVRPVDSDGVVQELLY